MDGETAVGDDDEAVASEPLDALVAEPAPKSALAAKAKTKMVWWRAKLLNRLNAAHVHSSATYRRHAMKVEATLWLGGAIGLLLGAQFLQPLLPPYLSPDHIKTLQDLYGSLGAAMIGAAAIAASFVLFAMQVNVERLPYGLFRRFSGDARLLTAFATSFILAIALACFSLSDDPDWVARLLASALLTVAVILRLFLFAYRRSLDLISPQQQLSLLVADGRRDVRLWERRIRWLSPVIEQAAARTGSPPRLGRHEVQFDGPRAAVLKANRTWSQGLADGVAHAASFARQAGERNDVEMSASALSTVMALNAYYVRVKGRTFRANNALSPNDEVTDGFINGTLEHLKQLCRAAVAQSAEGQIERIFHTYLGLVQLYLKIEYPGFGQSRSHALLALGYLEGAIESVLPHGLTDVAMDGQRLMGSAASTIIATGDASESSALVRKIAQVGCVGLVRANDRPLVQTAMQQLTNITMTLLRSEEASLHFMVGELRNAVRLVSEFMLESADTPLNSSHSFYLQPYFSSITNTGLRNQLTALVNALVKAPAESEDAERVIRNLEEWSDGLSQQIKTLLMLAIQKRSHFTLDLLHWIEGVTECLLATSVAPACREHEQEELRKHADWLLSVFSWMPKDAESVRFVETFRPNDILFDIAWKCARWDALEIRITAEKLMLAWTIQAGAHQTGWATLARGLMALVALVAIDGEQGRPEALTAAVTARLGRPEAPSQELRDSAARNLREAADDLHERQFEVDAVEGALRSGNRDRTRTTLRELANILSPGTENAPRGRGPFFR